MGNDGGTIAVQRGIVIQQKKIPNPTQSLRDQHSLFWTSCRYSGRTLDSKKPIVACSLGYLYDKESVLEALLQKKFRRNKQLKESFGHIRKLSDLQDVHFSFSPSPSKEGSPWICPLTLRPLDGAQICSHLRPCGHVVLTSARNDPLLWPNSNMCVMCNENVEDAAELNPTLSEEQRLRSLKKKVARMRKMSNKPYIREKNHGLEDSGCTLPKLENTTSLLQGDGDVTSIWENGPPSFNSKKRKRGESPQN